ncbi:MAG: Uma2 family endonuclease [Candidatus Rokuibacteriota bacterium]
MAPYPIRNRHWTRKEYDQLIRIGFFYEDEPIELLGGQLIVAEPKGSPHSTAIALTAEALRAAFGPGWLVRVQDPVALDNESEPEPDVVVVPGRPRDYVAEHPTRPALLVEIAESSLAFDRGHKGSLYARAGVADYWIVNLVDEVLEIYRQPALDQSATFGWRYLDVEPLRPGNIVSPLARPDVTVAVADLLP